MEQLLIAQQVVNKAAIQVLDDAINFLASDLTTEGHFTRRICQGIRRQLETALRELETNRWA